MVVSFASSIGATIAFLISRFCFRSYVRVNFRQYVDLVDEGIKRDGAIYLFSLRLVPLFPFFIVNLIMGIMPIRVVILYVISQVGMLPLTMLYVDAGTKLGQLDSPGDILSLNVFISLVVIGIFRMSSFNGGELLFSKIYKLFTKAIFIKNTFTLKLIGCFQYSITQF